MDKIKTRFLFVFYVKKYIYVDYTFVGDRMILVIFHCDFVFLD